MNNVNGGSRYYSCAETAAELRKALKATFPGIVFGVRSKTYSGGASITVSWTDGPTSAAVKSVCCKFEGADFDGMIDLKSYKKSEFQGERVHWGADYIFERRDQGDLAQRTAQAIALQKYGVNLTPDFDGPIPGFGRCYGVNGYERFSFEQAVRSLTCDVDLREGVQP